MPIIYTLLQCTWGILQTFIGLALFIIHIGEKHYRFHGALVTEWKSRYCVSLGMFIFVTKKTDPEGQLIAHEYGHTIQSLILGPVYLLVVGLPSMLWCALPVFTEYRKKKDISYYSFYPERWADLLGERTTGIKTKR